MYRRASPAEQHRTIEQFCKYKVNLRWFGSLAPAMAEGWRMPFLICLWIRKWMGNVYIDAKTRERSMRERVAKCIHVEVLIYLTQLHLVVAVWTKARHGECTASGLARFVRQSWSACIALVEFGSYCRSHLHQRTYESGHEHGPEVEALLPIHLIVAREKGPGSNSDNI